MKSLEELLDTCTDEQLRQIYRLWGLSKEADDQHHPAKIHITRISELTNNPVALRFVWEHLTEDERELFYALLKPHNRNGIEGAKLQDKVNLSAERYEVAFNKLISYALIYEEIREDLSKITRTNKKATPTPFIFPYKPLVIQGYETGREIFASTTSPVDMTHAELLATLQSAPLSHIITANNFFDPHAYTPYSSSYIPLATMRQLIASEFMRPATIITAIQRLSPEIRDFLQWFYTQGRQASMDDVRQHTKYDDTNLFTLIIALTTQGLAFDCMLKTGKRALFVPANLHPILCAALEDAFREPPPARLQTIDEPPIVRPGEPKVQYDLVTIISATYQQALQPTQAGRLHKRFAQKIQSALRALPRYQYDGENHYIDMLFAFASELELIHCPPPPLQDMKPTYEVSVTIDTWTSLTLQEQTQMLLQQWQDSTIWLDLYGEYFQRAYNVWDTYAWTPKQGRALLLKYLRQCQPGRWYSIPSLLELIYKEEPVALYNTTYRHPSKASYIEDHAKWMQADGEVYKGLLASSLYDFGIVNLGDLKKKRASEDDDDEEIILAPDAFQLTALGAAVLTQTQLTHDQDDPAQLTRRSLIVQPNFELLLLEEDITTLYALLPFAQLQHAGQVSRLLLTRTSLLRGMSAGVTIDTILTTLRSHSQKDLPQNVEYTLQDWSRGYKGARVSQVLLLEVSSEALADEICSAARFKALRPRRIGPLAVAAYCDINQVQRTLNKEEIALHISGQINSVERAHRY